MAEPIKWKSKIILVKPEGENYGADPTPTGALNAMLLTDVQLQPMEGEDVSRNLELPYLGAQEELPSGLRVVLTGSFELVGSGEPGVAPAWGPLLRACGVAEVVTPDMSVEYNPVSDDHESVGIHFHIGPSRHVILAALNEAIDKAKVDLDAGVEGAGDALASLFEQRLTASKEAYGTTGAYAADRAATLDDARAAIAKANAQIVAAQAKSDPALLTTNKALDENNDQNAEMIDALRTNNALLTSILASNAGSGDAAQRLVRLAAV